MVAKFSQLIAVLLVCCALVSGQPTSKVVGGENAEIGQFPYQVVLLKDGDFICGGSIISSRYILTAAHCVVVGNGIEPLPASYFSVRVGSIQRLAGGKLISVKKVIVRPTFSNFLDDVALLELQHELVFTDNIKKIDLFDGEVDEGEPVVVSGWGRLTQAGEIPYRLQYNTLNVMSQEKCQEEIGWGFDQLICLAHEKGNGVCNGDSGGPATYKGKLVGVANFVYGGCGNVFPDEYAKVSYHREWILANMI